MTRPVAPIVVVVGLLAACSSPALHEVDLMALAPVAERAGERRWIPLDEDGAGQLVAGWSWPEPTRDGRSLRWAVGERSVVRFFCVEPRDLTITIEARSFAGLGPAGQGVRCRVNGHDLGRRSFRGWSEVRFPVPARVVAAGDNVVELSWDRAARPSDLGRSGDRRQLAAAIRSLAVEGLLEPAPEVADAVVVGRASELRFAVYAGAEASLMVRPGPGAGASLEVWSRQDGDVFRRVGEAASPGRPLALGNRAGPIEVALRAGRQGSVRLEGAAVSWRAPASAAVELPSFEGPDVVLYVVDTLRADRLGGHGGPQGLTPFADRLAVDGVLFERATAQSSWTKPSMVSVLSGRLTTEHGVRSREPVVPAEVTSVAERFAAAGYRTGAFTTNAYLTRDAGFDRGFETFEFAHLDGHTVTRRAIDWLAVEDRRPTFLWVHTIDPHAPYEPRPEYRERWAPGIPAEVGTSLHVRSLGGQPAAVTAPFVTQYLALYDAEVAQNDAAFGELLDHLERSGRYHDSCIVLASDHGEGFWEHGVNGHGWDLFEEALHVPLVVKPPRWRRGGQRVGHPVQHVDLAPTLLRIAGLEPLETPEGRDLFAPALPTPRIVFSEMLYDGREGFAVRAGDLKLVEPLSRGFLPERALFDLEADPGETTSLADQLPVTAAWLAQEGRRRMALLAHAPRPEREVELSPEERRALSELGYLEPE